MTTKLYSVIGYNSKHPTSADIEFHRRAYLAPVLAELARRKETRTPMRNMEVFEFAVQWQERIAALLEIRAGIAS